MAMTVSEARDMIKAGAEAGLSVTEIVAQLRKHGYKGQRTKKPISEMAVRHHMKSMGLKPGESAHNHALGVVAGTLAKGPKRSPEDVLRLVDAIMTTAWKAPVKLELLKDLLKN